MSAPGTQPAAVPRPVPAVPASAARAHSRRGAYAGVVTRGAAFVLDGLLLSIAWTAGLFASQALLSLFDLGDGEISTVLDGLAAGSAGLVLVFLYHTLCVAIFGKTVGKAIFGLRVVRPDGTKPSLGRCALRSVAYFFSGIMLLGFLWVAVDGRRQGWHDKVAGTFVVYDWELRRGVTAQTPLSAPVVPHR